MTTPSDGEASQWTCIVSLNQLVDIDSAFESLAQERIDAVIIGTNQLFTSRRNQLAVLAARHALPAIYYLQEFADAGGLANVTDAYRLGGGYVGRIRQRCDEGIKRGGTQFGRKPVLDAGQCRKIAERYAAGETMAELARDYGCGEATIWRALHPAR